MAQQAYCAWLMGVSGCQAVHPCAGAGTSAHLPSNFVQLMQHTFNSSDMSSTAYDASCMSLLVTVIARL